MHSLLAKKASAKLIGGVPFPGKCTPCQIRPISLRGLLDEFVGNLIPRALVLSLLPRGDRTKFLVLGNMLCILFTVLCLLMR